MSPEALEKAFKIILLELHDTSNFFFDPSEIMATREPGLVFSITFDEKTKTKYFLKVMA